MLRACTNPKNETYFTYTFIWWLKGEHRLTAAELRSHLLQYFRGLYKAVSKKEEKDVSRFSAEIEKISPQDATDGGKEQYRGHVAWVDPFVTEEKLVLNVKVWRWYCGAEGRSAMFFALSPKPYEHANWQLMESQEAGRCQ